MSEQAFVDDGDPKRYFAQIPNIVLKLGLSPYALALYMHIKQTAAEDGRCTKSTPTLATETGMGAGSISRAKDELAKPFPLLNNKPLIVITPEPARAGKPRHIITVVDIWPENMTHFGSGRSTGEHQISTGEIHRSNREICRSTGEIKKNHSRITTQEDKNPNKRERATTLPENFEAPEPPEKLKGSFTPDQLADEFEQFRDYHTAKDTKFKDWNAGWRTWLRNAVKFRGGPQRKRALRAVSDQAWDGDSQLDVPGYAWKPKPMSFEEKIRELMEITGWTREAAITELELKGHGPNGRTAAAA